MESVEGRTKQGGKEAFFAGDCKHSAKQAVFLEDFVEVDGEIDI